MSTQLTERLCKWRNLYAMMATMGNANAFQRYIRDVADKMLLLRAEHSSLTALLIQKGIITSLEFTAQLDVEAEVLMTVMEQAYPGFTATDDGITLSNPMAQETMRRWMMTPGMGKPT